MTEEEGVTAVPQLIHPEWPAPATVRAAVTTRRGGYSNEPYASFNLATHVGDDPEAVARNRRLLQQQLGLAGEPQWIKQCHGVGVVAADHPGEWPVADAVFTGKRGQACAVLTADCLPVLFCNREGTRVAVAHAGWRGLAAGILESTLAVFDEDKGNILAWLGPAISQPHFQVGPEVREAFLDTSTGSDPAAVKKAFIPCAERIGHFRADLYQLARLRLGSCGLTRIFGGGFCTFSEQRFYSYRRQAVTGRMATLIWLDPGLVD
jgi:YfiH family protein